MSKRLSEIFAEYQSMQKFGCGLYVMLWVFMGGLIWAIHDERWGWAAFFAAIAFVVLIAVMWIEDDVKKLKEKYKFGKKQG